MHGRPRFLNRNMIVSSTAPVPTILNIPLLERIRAAAGDFVPLHELGADLERVRIDLDALDRVRVRHRTSTPIAEQPTRDRPSGSVPTRSSMNWRPDGSAGGSQSGTESAVPTTWRLGPVTRSPTMAWLCWPRTRRPAAAAAVGRGLPRPERRS